MHANTLFRSEESGEMARLFKFHAAIAIGDNNIVHDRTFLDVQTLLYSDRGKSTEHLTPTGLLNIPPPGRRGTAPNPATCTARCPAELGRHPTAETGPATIGTRGGSSCRVEPALTDKQTSTASKVTKRVVIRAFRNRMTSLLSPLISNCLADLLQSTNIGESNILASRRIGSDFH